MGPIGERGGTFVRFVLVLEDEGGHAPIVPPRHPENIGWVP
jgi:hypothetical protein